MFESLHQIEFKIMRDIQHFFHAESIQEVLYSLNLLDHYLIYLLLIGIIYHFKSDKLALSLFALFLFSSEINQLFKNLFAQPRPCLVDASVCHISKDSIFFPGSFGIPSNGAQSWFVYLTYFSYEIKSKKVWWFSGFFILLIGLSRVLLGVHFISDVIGGWLIGLLVVVSFIHLKPKIISFFSKMEETRKILILILITAALSPLAFDFYTSLQYALGIGFFFGLLFTEPLNLASTKGKMCMRFFIWASITFLLYSINFVRPNLTSFVFLGAYSLVNIVLGLWLSLLSSVTFRSLKALK